MRFIANEIVMRELVEALRIKGHDVLSVKESMRGIADDAILAAAMSQERIVLSNDKDFGELAFRTGLPAECGIILLRLSGLNREQQLERTLEAVDSRNDWVGHFSVIAPD